MKHILLLSIFSLVLTGCFFGSNDNDKPGSADGKGPVDAVITWSELQGVWQTDCFTTAEAGKYLRYVARFYQSGSETPPAYELRTEYFSDSSCTASGSTWLFAVQDSGRVDLLLNASNTARQLNLTTAAVYLLVRSPDGYSELQTRGECGISYSGQEYSTITGLSCDNLGDMKAGDEVEYNIVGKTSGGIVFGNQATGNTESEASRPTSLSINPVFKKLVN